MLAALWRHHAWRYALQSALAVAATILCAIINKNYVVWAALGSLLTVQTSRGTPVRQGLSALLTAMLAVIAGYLLSQSLTLELAVTLMAATVLACSIFLSLRQPVHYLVMLQWVVPAAMLTLATLWAAQNELMLAHRLMALFAGGSSGIVCSVLVLPVMPYWEFRQGMLPILQALIQYSKALADDMQSQPARHASLDKARLKIETVMQSHVNEYPEWVFESGFNRNLRSSFRYILVQLERITDGFFSLDYHARQEMDPELIVELAPLFAEVLGKNNQLLQIMFSFFANLPIHQSNEDFTSDVVALNNALRAILPVSVELLDISPDYLNISALARDVIDIRELLLQVVAALPIDQFAITE